MENSWRNKFGHLKGNFGCKRWWQCWLNVGLEKTFHARYKFEIWDRNWLITSNNFFPRVRGEGLCNNVHCDKQIMRRYFYKYASRKPLRQLILRPTFPCRGRLYTELYCLQVLFFGNIRSHPALIGTQVLYDPRTENDRSHQLYTPRRKHVTALTSTYKMISNAASMAQREKSCPSEERITSE